MVLAIAWSLACGGGGGSGIDGTYTGSTKKTFIGSGAATKTASTDVDVTLVVTGSMYDLTLRGPSPIGSLICLGDGITERGGGPSLGSGFTPCSGSCYVLTNITTRGTSGNDVTLDFYLDADPGNSKCKGKPKIYVSQAKTTRH